MSSCAGTLTLTGTILLQGAVGAVATASGSMTAVAGMGGGAAALVFVAAGLVARAEAQGSIVGSSSLQAELGGTASLEGEVEGFGSTSATLRRLAAMSATLAASGSPMADLRGVASLQGSTDWEGSQDGDLATGEDWIGAIAATGALAGDLKGAAALTGAVTGAGAFAGDAEAFAQVAGAVAGSAVVAGAASGVASMSGSIAGAGALASANLKGTASFGGAITALATPVADLRGVASFSGSVGGVADADADLEGGSDLEGTIAATGALAANLKGASALAGALAGAAVVAGDVEAMAQVAGTIAAVGTPAANLKGSAALTGAVTAVGTPAANLKGSAALTGTIAASAAVAGAIRSLAAAVGSIAATAAPAGGLKGSAALAGALASSATVAGALRRLVAAVGSVAGTGAFAADLSVSSAGFTFTDIDWAAFWKAADRVDASGVASSLPNSATGADDAGSTADITYASGDRPTIDDTITAANNQPGLIANNDSYGVTGAGTWWEMSSTSGKFIWFHLAINGGTTGAQTWFRTVSYSSRGGANLNVRNYNASQADVEESGGVVALANAPTAANVPVPATVPSVQVVEYDGRGGSGIVKFVSLGVRDAGTAGTIGIIEANTNSGMGHLGASAASKTAQGTFLLGGVLRTWLSWLEDAQMLDLLETDWSVTGHHCIHRMAPILHLTSRATVVSSEFSHWLHLQTGLLGFTNGDASERPAESTLAGLPAPYFRGNTELNYLDSSTGAIGLISNASEYHVFIVFQSNNQTSGSPGSGGYWVDAALLSGVDGYWAISLSDAGAVTHGFLSDTDGDVEVWTAGGADDNAIHVVHCWYSLADTELGIQIDDDTAVTDTVTDGPATQADLMRVGANYAPNQELEAKMHIWAHGAMTTDEIADFYAMLEFRYGVTVP